MSKTDVIVDEITENITIEVQSDSGNVDSVNGKTGAVQLFPSDISINTGGLNYLNATDLFELAEDIDFEFAQVYDDLASKENLKTFKEIELDNYTLTNNDVNNFLVFNSNNPITLYVPANLDRSIVFQGVQNGDGKITFSGVGIIEIESADESLETGGKNDVFRLTKKSENKYVLQNQNFAGVNSIEDIFFDYTDTTAMISGQSNQSNQAVYAVVDASDDSNITFANGETRLQAFYRYNGVDTGSIDDYTLISAPYALGNSEYVNILDYGCDVGSLDNYSEFLAALNVAKAQNKKLFIPSGEFNIVYTDLTAIDMNGCAGIEGDGTLIFDVLEADTPVLEWEGEITLIASNISITKKDTTVNLGTGLTLKPGDTVFAVSTQKITNTDSNYTEGQRLTVAKYNSSTGLATFFERFHYSITDTYFYINSVKPKVVLNGVKIFAKNNVARKGVRIALADATVENVYIKSFARICLNVSSSKLYIANYKARDFYYDGSATSYGLQISGLTRSEAYALDLKGGRHALTHGDDGSWNEGHAGGDSGTPMFLSSYSVVFGGEYASHPDTTEPCVDTHGGTYFFEMIGGVVNNGIGLGNRYARFFNTKIYPTTSNQNAILSTRSLDGTIPRGSFYFDSCDFAGGGAIFSAQGSINDLNLLNCKVTGVYPVGSNSSLTSYGSNIKIEKLNVQNFEININSGTQTTLELGVNSLSTIKNIKSNYAQIRLFQDRAGDFSMNIDDIRSYNSFARGFLISNPNGYLGRFVFNNISVYNPILEGFYINNIHKITMDNVRVEGASGIGLRVKVFDTSLKMSNINVTGGELRGLYVQQDTGDTASEYGIVNGDFRNNGGINYSVDASVTELQKIGVLS